MESFRRRVFRATPRIWMTYVLMGLVVAGYIWEIIVTGDFMAFNVPGLIAAGANCGPYTLYGEWWRLFSCIFLHGSLMHIVMNLFCFYSFGPLVERLVGNWGLAALFIVSGLFGSITSVNWNPNVTSIGASGAVFGVAGALLGYLLQQRRNIPAALLSELTNGAATFVVLNIVLAATIKHVDQAAHIGGLVSGFIVGFIQASDSSPESVTWRPLRNGLVILLGVVALITAIQVHREPEVQAFLRYRPELVPELNGIERDRYQIEKLAQKIMKGDDATDADESAKIRIDRDVLAPWQKVRERLEVIRNVAPPLKVEFAERADYLSKREASWQLFLQYLKTLDEKKLHESQTATEEADRVLQELNNDADQSPTQNEA